MIQIDVLEIKNTIEAQVANPEFASALLTSLKVSGMATLKEAGPTDVAFFFSKHYESDLMTTKAGVVVTGSAFVKAIEEASVPAWKKGVFLACENPYLQMGRMTSLFSTALSSHDHRRSRVEASRIHPTAILAEGVKLGSGVEVGAYVVVEAGTEIGNNAVIYPHCYIGKNCIIGQGSVLFPRVTLYEKTKIGERCRIHAGVVLGADGFGYVPINDPASKKAVDHQKIYHLGNVVLEDDVEIGANTTIDRGTFGSTLVSSKTKIDNLVMIGHNAEIGEGTIICGEAGMGGSASTGKFVTLTAQSSVGNQVHVGDYSFIAAYTGVSKSCGPESQLMGIPARPLDEYFKILAIQNKLLRDRKKDRKNS